MKSEKKSNKNSTSKKAGNRGFLSRTKFYIAEYTSFTVLSAILGVTLIIFVNAVFSSTFGDGISRNLLNDLAWSFGLYLVFGAPLVLLYARTSAEELHSPGRLDQVFRKVVYYIILSLTAVTALVTTIMASYIFAQFIFGLKSYSGDSFTVRFFPSLIIATLAYYFGFLVLSRSKPKTSSIRSLNIGILSFIVVVIVAASVSVGLVNRSAIGRDEARVQDLEKVQIKINDYYADEKKLPANISVLDVGDKIKLEFSDGEYSYKVDNCAYPNNLNQVEEPGEDLSYPELYNFNGCSNYQLCAEFETKSNSYFEAPYNYYDVNQDALQYRSNLEFDYHGKGKQCFYLSA